MLAQGVFIGLGSGCLFVPSIAVVATYFTAKRALATGIAVGGSSLGGILYPIAFHRLQPSIGFGWATRVISFITLALLLIAVAVMKSRLPPKAGRSLFQPSALKNIPFILMSLGISMGFIGLYVPMFYIQTYALTRRITCDTNYAFYLLSILNAGSFFGRILPNFLADKIGALNMLVPCTIAAGVLCLAWIAISNVTGITVFAVLYGIFAGAYVSLVPAVIVDLTPDMSVIGTWMGMSLFIAAFGLLIGNPIAGALINVERADLLLGKDLRVQSYCLGHCFLSQLIYYKDSRREARRHRANEGAILGMILSMEQVDAVICKAVRTCSRVLLSLSQIFLETCR